VEHAATVTMQIADTYVTRCQRPAVAHCRDNVVLCRSYNGKLERRDKSRSTLGRAARAAEFMTDCSRFSCLAGKPASVEQP